MVTTRSSVNTKQKAARVVKKRLVRVKVNGPSSSVTPSTSNSRVILTRSKGKPPAQYCSGALVDAKRSCKRLRRTDEITPTMPVPPAPHKKFKNDTPKAQNKGASQVHHTFLRAEEPAVSPRDVDPIALPIQAGKSSPALVTESEGIATITEPSAFVNMLVKITLSDTVDKMKKRAEIIDSFVALMTRSSVGPSHTAPSAPTLQSELGPYDIKRVGHLKALLFPQMGARSAGAVPAEISSTGTIISLIQASFR